MKYQDNVWVIEVRVDDRVYFWKDSENRMIAWPTRNMARNYRSMSFGSKSKAYKVRRLIPDFN